MKFKNLIGAFAGITLLAGCAAATSINDVEKLNDTAAVGSEFTRALASEYRELANFEQFEMFDYRDARYHAAKGLAAASGEVVLPSELSERYIEAADAGELSAARGRLMSVFNRDARNLFPNEAAVAQTRFDCWLEQLEEGFQLDHIRACREEFRAALAAIEDKLNAGPAVAAASPDRFIVFFGFDSVEIPASAASILANAARVIGDSDGAVVDIVGHADTSGAAAYNQALSERRAAAVQSALSSRGIDVGSMTTSGRGERALLVETPDGTREPSNRRAEIILR
ncbi:MAG: OmpA family protein [Alphaproteobacteria bacterium]|nr:OmpA family protein [Alphaproteobacteria bacterium SS10]